MIRIFLASAALTCAAAIGVASLGAGAPERTGYFKSDGAAGPHRVVAYRAPAPVTAEEARAILARAPRTDGRITVALLYAGAAPGAALTTAGSMRAALALVSEGPWAGWEYRLWFNGATGEEMFRAR